MRWMSPAVPSKLVREWGRRLFIAYHEKDPSKSMVGYLSRNLASDSLSRNLDLQVYGSG